MIQLDLSISCSIIENQIGGKNITEKIRKINSQYKYLAIQKRNWVGGTSLLGIHTSVQVLSGAIGLGCAHWYMLKPQMLNILHGAAKHDIGWLCGTLRPQGGRAK